MLRFTAGVARRRCLQLGTAAHAWRGMSLTGSAGDGGDDFVDPGTGTAPTDAALGVTRKVELEGAYLTRLGEVVQVPAQVEENQAEDLFDELERDAAADVSAAAPQQPLGFDDDTLAQKVLEMEANGALDEAWQDRPQASPEDVAALCEMLRELKVSDVCAIRTAEKTSSFDFMIFGTCTGSRHIGIAAWAVSEADEQHRVAKPKRRKTDDEWEVVTCGRIVVNLMQQGYRDTANLERKWALTENTDPLAIARSAVSEGRNVKLHGLWTLTLNLQDLEDFEADYCKDALLRQL